MNKEIVCQKCKERTEATQVKDIYGLWEFLGFPPVMKCAKCGYKNQYPLKTKWWNISLFIVGLLWGIFGGEEYRLTATVFTTVFLVALIRDFRIRRKLKK